MDQWLSAPIDNLRTLLSGLAAVQTFLGAGDATEALASIYPHEAAAAPLPIVASTTGVAGAASIDVAGDVTALLSTGAALLIRDSTGNDGLFHVRAGSSYAAGSPGLSTINLVEALTDDTDDGRVQLQHMPRIIVGMLDGRSQRRRSNNEWVDSGGGLWALLEQETPAAYWTPSTGIDNPSTAGHTFLGQVEDIVDELKAAQGVDGALHVDSINAATGPMEGDPDDNYGRAYWWQALGFETGVGG